jgi:hypothetical protein
LASPPNIFGPERNTLALKQRLNHFRHRPLFW